MVRLVGEQTVRDNVGPCKLGTGGRKGRELVNAAWCVAECTFGGFTGKSRKRRLKNSKLGREIYAPIVEANLWEWFGYARVTSSDPSRP